MKITLILTITILVLSLSGCVSNPIRTTLDLTTEPSPTLNYSSEKDVLYSRTVTDPETGVVESVVFQSTASAPGLVQAQRDKALAETNAKLLDTVNALLAK